MQIFPRVQEHKLPVPPPEDLQVRQDLPIQIRLQLLSFRDGELFEV